MTKQSGQILVIVIAALGVVLFTVLAIIAGAQAYYQNAYYSVESEKATALAEAGVDKGLSSLNKDPVSYNGESETFFGDGSYSVTITNIDAANKKLTATGYIPNKTKPKLKRTIAIQVSKGTGFSFNYGLQIGEGGLIIGNDSTLDGSVYSNGDITGGDGTLITGNVYVAGGAQPSADQVSDCEGVNCQEYVFGRNISGEDRRDVAQSFKPSETNILNKVSLKLRKTGSPANPTVRIMSDLGGKPNKNGILATGTLSADLVSQSSPPSFVDVSFSSSPSLNAGTTYWIMIHANSLDYWYWSNDLAQSYGNGVPKWSSNWQAGSPVWTAFPGDLGFKTFMGGVVTSINLGNSSQVTGDVHANNITGNMTINGDAYFQTIGPQVTVNGTPYPGSPDSPPAVFPVSDANITDWQNQAADPEAGGGETYGNINGCNMTLGPRKIIGNLTLGNSCTVTVKSPLWITGNVTTGNSSKFVLDSSYGLSSGVVIVRGTVTFGNGGDIRGSGSEGSYLMLLSTFDSTLNGTAAVTFGNTPDLGIAGIVYAPKGKIVLGNGGKFKEFTGWKIELGNGSILSYSTGLASTFFSSGPTGAYSLVSGTYQVK